MLLPVVKASAMRMKSNSVELSLQIAAPMVKSAAVKRQSIARRLDEGFLDATVLAEYLVRKGVPFRTAHQIVGSMVAHCESQGLTRLADVPLEAMRKLSPEMGSDVMAVLGAANVVAAYQSSGAGGKTQLSAQLKRWNKLLKK